MVKKAAWQVQLGQLEWARFTYERPKGDPLQLLGSVRRGAQMGALALTSDGQYVQVVGDLVEPLSRSQIDKAIAKAKGRAGVGRREGRGDSRGDGQQHTFRPAAPRPGPAPVVIVKRRRVIGGMPRA